MCHCLFKKSSKSAGNFQVEKWSQTSNMAVPEAVCSSIKNTGSKIRFPALKHEHESFSAKLNTFWEDISGRSTHWEVIITSRRQRVCASLLTGHAGSDWSNTALQDKIRPSWTVQRENTNFVFFFRKKNCSGWTFNRSTDWKVLWWTLQSVDWLIDRLIDWTFDWFIDWFIDWDGRTHKFLNTQVDNALPLFAGNLKKIHINSRDQQWLCHIKNYFCRCSSATNASGVAP